MLGTLPDFQRALLGWYRQHRRDLPWRTPTGAPASARPNPYFVLVSETMLQQTQVATVKPFFSRFIQRFPDLATLAAADPQELLRLWQGLGYYSHARNLQATAKIVVNQYHKRLPSSVPKLLALPGIGPYTAGAIASLAFGQRAAILDGNVSRVLCRIDAIAQDPRCSTVRNSLWQRAYQILPRRNVGEFNSALMDLGATVCTPRSPACDLCPVQSHCTARTAGIQADLPRSAARKHRPIERRCTICIRCARRYLIEQRPPRGRWASMWQFLTIPAEKPSRATLARSLGLPLSSLRHIGSIQHELTHRRYFFEVYRCSANSPRDLAPRRWVSLDQLSDYPMPAPHVRIRQLLSNGG